MPRKPFKKRLKEFLEGVAGLLIVIVVGAIVTALAAEVPSAWGVAVMAGVAAAFFSWLASLVKPKRRKWVAAGTSEDWSL